MEIINWSLTSHPPSPGSSQRPLPPPPYSVIRLQAIFASTVNVRCKVHFEIMAIVTSLSYSRRFSLRGIEAFWMSVCGGWGGGVDAWPAWPPRERGGMKCHNHLQNRARRLWTSSCPSAPPKIPWISSDYYLTIQRGDGVALAELKA